VKTLGVRDPLGKWRFRAQGGSHRQVSTGIRFSGDDGVEFLHPFTQSAESIRIKQALTRVSLFSDCTCSVACFADQQSTSTSTIFSPSRAVGCSRFLLLAPLPPLSLPITSLAFVVSRRSGERSKRKGIRWRLTWVGCNSCGVLIHSSGATVALNLSSPCLPASCTHHSSCHTI
jgi:hypothetical protein